MKKTDYEMMVSAGVVNSTWRRVYEKDGRFYVKYQNEILDVTDKQEYFLKEHIFN